MLGPVQHTSLPIEPVRQHLTPPAPTLPPPPAPAASLPLQASHRPKDKFGEKDREHPAGQDKHHNPARQQNRDKSRAITGVWAQLIDLQRRLRDTRDGGDPTVARQFAFDAALEAGKIAGQIRDLVNHLHGTPDGLSDMATALDNARPALGAALQLVDLAADLPTHPVANRLAIAGARHQVMDALAALEAVTADFLFSGSGGHRQPMQGRLDVKV